MDRALQGYGISMASTCAFCNLGKKSWTIFFFITPWLELCGRP